MNGWLLGLMALAVAALAALTARLWSIHKRQELMQERIRTSETYRCLKPLLERCRTLRVERVTLRPEAVTVALYDPAGKTLRCRFEEHGLDPVSPEPLLALAQAVAVDLPMLGDNQRYFFKVYREEAGDETLRWYEYMIQPDYKDSILRKRYDRMDL